MAKYPAKNKELTLAEKVRVIEELDSTKISQRLLGLRFGVSQPQISRIIKNKERLLSEWRNHGNPGRKRQGRATPVEEALLRWLDCARSSGHPVTSPALKMAARKLAAALGHEGFWPSNGWLSRFKQRHNIVLGGARRRGGGSSGGGSGQGAAGLQGFPAGDVYGCAEAAVDLGEEGLAVLLCASANGGDKRKLLVVGASSELPGGELPVTYLPGPEGPRLTADLFAVWLADFDREMGQDGRQVALVVEQARRSPRPPLANVRLLSPPPGSLRARDLARHFQRLYQSRLPGRVSSAAGGVAGERAVLEALRLMATAWQDLPPATIALCFRGLRPGAPEPSPERADDGPAPDEPPATPQGPETPCHTAAQALQCLAGLRHFFESHGGCGSAHQQICSLEDEVAKLAAATGTAAAAEQPGENKAQPDTTAECDRTLQFQFPEHPLSAARMMEQLRREGSFCDVTIVAEGLRFPGHRVVLAACSPFLRDRFRIDPSPEIRVPLKTSPEVLRQLLLCCYTGALAVPFKDVVSYLTAASLLQMEPVVEGCRRSFSPCAAVPGQPAARSTAVQTEPPAGVEGIRIAKVESLAGEPEAAWGQGGSEQLRASGGRAPAEAPPPSHAPGGPPAANEELRQLFPCPTCGKVFRHKAHLARHSSVHTGLKCLICGTTFSQSQSLQDHARAHHPGCGLSPVPAPHCQPCGTTFASLRTLRAHLRLRHSQIPQPARDPSQARVAQIDVAVP